MTAKKTMVDDEREFHRAYEILADQSKCDAPDGCEYERVLAEWREAGRPTPIEDFIYRRANAAHDDLIAVESARDYETIAEATVLAERILEDWAHSRGTLEAARLAHLVLTLHDMSYAEAAPDSADASDRYLAEPPE